MRLFSKYPGIGTGTQNTKRLRRSQYQQIAPTCNVLSISAQAKIRGCLIPNSRTQGNHRFTTLSKQWNNESFQSGAGAYAREHNAGVAGDHRREKMQTGAAVPRVHSTALSFRRGGFLNQLYIQKWCPVKIAVWVNPASLVAGKNQPRTRFRRNLRPGPIGDV